MASAYWINELGTWFGDVALAILVFSRTASPLATAGLFLVLRFAPSLVAPLLTTKVETVAARLSLPLLLSGEGVLYGLIALVAHHFSLPLVLILAALDGALAITAKALTRSACAGDLISLDLLREGNAILNMGFMAASALGPGLAGALTAWKGASAALSVDAITFLVAAVVVASARQLHVESDHEAGALGRLKTGARTVKHDANLLWLFVAFGAALMLSSVAVPVEVVFAKATLHAGDRGYGFLLGAWGVGMIAGGAAFTATKAIRNEWLLAAAMVLLAAGYGGLAASPDLGIACIFSAVGGIGNGVGGVTAITAIQRAIPLRTQSAVMAIFEAINQSMPALGFVLGGVVTALDSPRLAYAISAAGVALVLVIAAAHFRAGSRVAAASEDQMAAPTPTTPVVIKTPARKPPLTRRERMAIAVHLVLLAAVVVTAVMTGHDDNWKLGWLALILGLAIGSELMAVTVADHVVYVSGSFLGIMVAAVLLGGGPAAIVGVATILVGWTHSREAPHKLLHNVTAYAIFPLAAGLIFYLLLRWTGATTTDSGYYLLVFGAFLIGLTLNFAMTVAYVSATTGASPLRSMPWVRQIIAPEIFAALLTLTATYLANHIGAVGLLMTALVTSIYQYLIAQLLISQNRAIQLRTMATTDALTGLPNRARFGELVDEEIGSGGEFAVLLLDLDHFKDINDTLGPIHGDELIAQVAKRLTEHVGAGGVLGRHGGDEFAVLPALRTRSREQLDRVAEALTACVREPFTLVNTEVALSISIGISRYPKDGGDSSTLLRRADIALHVAKQQRDSHSFYESGQDQALAERLSLVSDFRRALDNGQLVLFYHPILDLTTGRPYGAEALIRWQHPERGLVMPDSFVPVIEQTGLVREMTASVLDQAVRDCVSWFQQGQELNVSVNLSVRNLLDPTMPMLVAAALDRHGLPPHRLKLEITESMIMSDPERALTTVRRLRTLGVQLAVDDFGTGHASLANLRLLPVDELKIDRSFVTPMLQEDLDMVIVRSTIDLGHALGLQVVAEGIEDEDTLEALKELGCDRAQGYYLSKPIPVESFWEWIQARTVTA